MSDQVKCQLCGEPMPAGEEMFNYHGYSGPCPKPPLPKPEPERNAMSELRDVWERVAKNFLAHIGNYYPDYPMALRETIALLELEHSKTQAELNEQLARIEQLECQLAGCDVAAMGWADKNPTSPAPKQGDWGWSPAFQSVLELRHKWEASKLEANEKLAGLREQAAQYVQQHDNLGNIAADEIRQLPSEQADAGVRAIEERIDDKWLGEIEKHTALDTELSSPVTSEQVVALLKAIEERRDKYWRQQAVETAVSEAVHHAEEVEAIEERVFASFVAALDVAAKERGSENAYAFADEYFERTKAKEALTEHDQAIERRVLEKAIAAAQDEIATSTGPTGGWLDSPKAIGAAITQAILACTEQREGE